MQMAFGEYCGILPTTVLTKKQAGSGNATPELALLRGKRFVVIQEPEGDDKINVGRMKELTGGDKIYVRPLYKEPYEYEPQFKLILTCNKLPFIPSNDKGTWRRLRVSPFESEFVDTNKAGTKTLDGEKLKDFQFPKDKRLKRKLKHWKRAFMWLLINKYYKMYRDADGDIIEPKKVTQYTDKYKKDSDKYHEYLSENITKTKNIKDIETLSNVYSAFRTWYKQSYPGNRPPSKSDFSDYLDNHGYKQKRGNVLKIRFKSDIENEENEENEEDIDNM